MYSQQSAFWEMMVTLLLYWCMIWSPPVAEQLLDLGSLFFSSEPPALKVEDVLAADDDEDDDAEEEGDQHEDDHRVLRSG